MKRRNINKNDATTNMELKALAKAFVESAVNEGYTASKIYSLTQQVWREITANMKEVDIQLLEENSEELEYRKKVEELVKDNPSIIYSWYEEIKYEENGETKITNATIELICAMHKSFLSNEKMTAIKLKKNVINRLKAMTPSYFPAAAEIDRAYCRICNFLKWQKSNCWCDELSNIYNSYKFRCDSATEYILIMEWYINHYDK